MSGVIKVEKLNEVFLHVYCEDMGVERDLVDYFTYEYPGAKFTPQYRARLWDGRVRLLDPIRKTLYVGLYNYIVRFAEINNLVIENINEIQSVDASISYEDITNYTNNLRLCSGGVPIIPRDYQFDSIFRAIRDRRCMLLSPTGSGKSLVIYSICRWHIDRARRTLLVAPTTSLVEQMYSDFQDYSTANGWSVEDNCQKLYSGFPKTFERNVLISTWQSIHRQPKQWFDQFDVIIGDEAHLFKGKSLTNIMEKLVNTQYRIGTTGSLDNKKVHKLVLEGIFGPVHKVTTTKKLQDKGQLANLKIKALILKYPNSMRKLCSRIDYQEEIQFIVANESRNKIIRNLALSTSGNTLLLFQFVEKHGKVLYDMIKDKASSRNVYYISGETNVDVREDIRKALSTETDAILIASVGTASTGINIPSIENIIFASPTKSVIRVLQSVGRGLRLNNNKSHCNLFDLTDDLSWKAWKNHTLKHGVERYKIYAQEEFPIKIVEVAISE